MSKGKSGNPLGVGGPRNNVPRSAMHGARTAGRGTRAGSDPGALKRELLRRLRQDREARGTGRDAR